MTVLCEGDGGGECEWGGGALMNVLMGRGANEEYDGVECESVGAIDDYCDIEGKDI